MSSALLPTDESERIAALRSLAILDSAPEPEYDAIVRLTSIFCETPISLLSFVDNDRQFFKARIGLNVAELPRATSFCAHAILEPETTLVVPDATEDDRFRDNPLVTGWPKIRFYAGVPLVMNGGEAIGTLCAIDRQPRVLSKLQLEALRAAAHSIIVLLEKRAADTHVKMLELVAVHAGDGVAIVSSGTQSPESSRIEYVNDAFKQLTGYSELELPGSEFGNMLLEYARDPRLSPSGATGKPRERLVHSPVLARKNGTTAEIEISLAEAVTGAGGNPRYMVAIVRDVSDRRRVAQERARAEVSKAANSALQREILERRRAELQLSHAASHDALTGLPNRILFSKSLDEAIAANGSHAGSLCALVFIDLDRFKKVNDSLGHLMGDALLVAVATRLRSVLRLADVVARFAGDEFTILLHDVRDRAEATIIVDRLARAFSEPFRLGTSDMFVTASIGVTIIEPKHASAKDALRDADMAMHAAKENGRARAQFYSQELDDRFSAGAGLETSLMKALQNKEFRLAYQPIVSLSDTAYKIQGFEALIRWRSPRGEMPPATFIPAAEETGLIVPIGDWVLNEACDRLAIWHATFAGRRGTLPSVSVNVSPTQFMSAQFVESVDGALARSGIDPAYLTLELTETTLMEDVEKGRAVLDALRARGCKVHLDDFGTGYCSFGYLRRFAVDRIKIDRSFVSGGDGPDKTERLANPEIIQAIITLAHSLHMKTIAEGVETDAQRHALAEMGCDAAQGFFFSPAVEDPSKMLERGRPTSRTTATFRPSLPASP